MCGIFGYIVESGKDLDDVRIVKLLANRGPDSQDVMKYDFSSQKKLSLIHTRLSIIDTSEAANQPLSDIRTGNSIVLNGEIYNYKELREELVSLGNKFATYSDTEVILKGYQQWGVDIFSKLRGMFATAIFDKKNQKLIVARDSFGIKPVYYYYENGDLIFSSSIQPIIESGIKEKFTINSNAINDYYSSGSFIQPSTILSEVKMLENGCFLIFDNNEIIIKSFKKLNEFVLYPDSCDQIKNPVEEVRNAIIDSIDKHFVSDVDVGVLLSAGIDSSLVAAVSSQILQKKISTYTIGFIDKELDNIDESKIAENTSRLLGTNQKTYSVNYDDFESSFNDFIDALDVPSYDGFNTFLISRKINKELKVVLSGLGADELFCGYQVFKSYYRYCYRHRYDNMLRYLPAKLLNAIGKNDISLMKLPDYKIISKNRTINLLSRNRTNVHHIFPMPSSFKLNSVTLFEADNYMKNTLLRDSDAVSMFNSLEIRVPFVDEHLYRVVSRVSDNFKVNSKINKPLLSEAFKDILPRPVMNRAKTGFTLPIQYWFNRYTKEHPLDLDELVEFNSLFNIGFIRKEHPYTQFMRTILACWISKNSNHLTCPLAS